MANCDSYFLRRIKVSEKTLNFAHVFENEITCLICYQHLGMKAWLTILLLVISNIFMTFAWYGHLKLQQLKLITSNTPLIVVILISWVIALAEYSCQVPANRIGYQGNGGSFSLMQLKVIQEAITLIIFTIFTVVFFKGEPLQWNHFAAFGCLIAAVYFVFLK